jgi:hypothetical protein
MRNLKIGDPVTLRDGAGWLGTVLDTVDGCPRRLLVYWHTPPNVGINPRLESEECLAFAQADGGSAENPGRAA